MFGNYLAKNWQHVGTTVMGMMMFFTVFLGVLWYALNRGNNAKFEHASKIPFNKDELK